MASWLPVHAASSPAVISRGTRSAQVSDRCVQTLNWLPVPAASGPSTISEGGGDLLRMLLQDRVSEDPSSLGEQSGVRRDDVALVEDRSPVPHEEHAGHAERVLVGRHDGEETSGHDEALKAALAEEARHQVGSARVLPRAD